MTINILTMVKNISKTNPDWKMLYHQLRVNDEIVDLDSKNFKVPPGYNYENLNLIERYKKTILWTNITVVGRPGEIELHHRAMFDIKGLFLFGAMNCFFKYMDMDNEVVSEYFSEIEHKFSSKKYWDLISDEIDESILSKFHINIPEHLRTKMIPSFKKSKLKKELYSL